MGDLAERKLELIREISAIEDSAVIQALIGYYQSLKSNRAEVLQKFAKPVRERLDPEMLKRQQHFQPYDHDEVMEIIRKIDIPESIDELVSQLSK